RVLANLARQASDTGDQPTAMLLALYGLPEPGFGGQRAFSPEAESALHQAWLRNRETTLVGHRGVVKSVSFGADGTQLLTASSDGTARIWDLREKRPTFAELKGTGKELHIGILSPDGARALTAGDDDVILVWDLHGERAQSTEVNGPAGSI